MSKTSLETALSYIERGWAPIPVPYRKKNPDTKGWQRLRITAENAAEHFKGGEQNISVLLGAPSGWLVDLDMDWPEAVALRKYFIPDTLVFGRKGNPSSHALVTSLGARTRKFQIATKEDGGMVLEIRSTGCQTVFPGSVHEGGDSIAFENDLQPTQIDADKLDQYCGHWAAASVLLKHWVPGVKDELAAAICGALLRCGWSDEKADGFVERISTAARDQDTPGKRKAERLRQQLESKQGGHVPGLPRLKELIGDQPADKIVEWLGLKPNNTANVAPSRLVTVLAADVAPQPINWLWPGRIARGKVTLLAGDPGLGKSLATLSLAAVVTTGGQWPVTRERCERGSVLLLSAEDDIADTQRPRLDAAGADPTRVRIIQAVETFDTKRNAFTEKMFSLQSDLDALDQTLDEMNDCALVIVDPVTAYLGGTDSHNNAEVRALLAPLSKIASKHHVAVVAVTHLNKGNGATAMHRFTGSLAFIAAARAAFVVTKDKDDPTRRLWLPTKNNLAEDMTGLAYRVRADENGVARIEWEPDLVTMLADELLTERPPTPRKRDETTAWLSELLSDGAVAVTEIKRLAEIQGFSWATIRVAQKKLGVDTKKLSYTEGWEWSLPEQF